VRQCRAAQARCRAAPGLRGHGRPAARLKAVPAEAGHCRQGPPGPAQGEGASRGLMARLRGAGLEPLGRAGGSDLASAATEQLRAAAKLPAAGRRPARWKVGRAEVDRYRRGWPDPARGEGALPAPMVRRRAAGLGPFAEVPGGAGRCRRTGLRRRWAGPAAQPGEWAKAAARSGRGPAAAARSVPPRARAARPAERAERPARVREPEAAPDDAAARARPGWRGVQPAARPAGEERSGSLRPDVPVQRDEPPAAGPARGGRQDVPARRAAGGADRACHHRRTGPGRAGAMERRNCPATA